MSDPSGTDESPPALVLNEVSHAYRMKRRDPKAGTPALRGVSAVFDSGSVTAIMGPNGCGKSTLLKLCAGLYIPSQGSILLEGHKAGSAYARASVGVVFQTPALDEVLTVRENLALHAHMLSGVQNLRNTIEKVAKALGIATHLDERVGSLSGGMKRRVELARVQIVIPKVLLMDEPEAGLDLTSRQELLRSAQLAASSGSCVIIATHNATLANACDRIMMMSNGSLILDSTPENACRALGTRVLYANALIGESHGLSAFTTECTVTNHEETCMIAGSNESIHALSQYLLSRGERVTVGPVDLESVYQSAMCGTHPLSRGSSR